MKPPIRIEPELLAGWAHARGEKLEAAAAEAIRPQVESLVGRLRALGRDLRPPDAPPAERPLDAA